MLTLPDFKEKKIVFIYNKEGFANELKFTNSNLRLYHDGKFVNQISYYLIFCIFIVGHTTITSKVIQEASKKGISIFFLDESLRTYAEIISSSDGNYLLRQKQYQMDIKEELHFAKLLVQNKIKNQFAVLKQYGHKSLIGSQKTILNNINNIDNFNDLLGLEGRFAKNYFAQIFKDFDWVGRSPRTRQDIENFLLDIGYTFLFNYIDSLLQLFGFDTYKGVYHRLFFQRKSLACDVMEPLRPLIDKEIIKSKNLGKFNKKDFVFKKGEFNFKDYEKRKKYVDIFLQALMDNRKEIYLYVLNFYRYFVNKEKYRYKEFKIR